MNKKDCILIYSNKDTLISSLIVNHIIGKFTNYNYDIKFSKKSFYTTIKICLVLFFYSSFSNFINFLKNRKNFSKKVNIVKKVDNLNRYKFALSVNYSKKIKKIQKTYNFHLGSFASQRGSFIFYYKFIKNWKYIDLTFHKISKRYDANYIINKKKIFVNNKDAVEIITLYLNNLSFVSTSINKIINKKYKLKKNRNRLSALHKPPNFYKLIANLNFFK